MKKQDNKFLETLLLVPILIGTPISLIIHTIVFIIFLTAPKWTNIEADSINLLLTTIVSLEAIYLSLFIQMSVNQSNATISVIKEDVEEIQEDVEEDDVEKIKNKNNSKTIKIGYTSLNSQQKINQQILRELQEIKNELKNFKN